MSRGAPARGRAVRQRACVVAIVLALLAIASVTASTIAPANARPAAVAVDERAAVGPLASAALGIVSELANTAFGFGLDKGFGWVLGQFGLVEEEPNKPDPQLAEMKQQLGEIQAKLQKIETQLNDLEAASRQLRAELQEASYANLVSQASTITSRVDKGMAELDYVAHMHADDPTKKARTEDALAFIKSHLMGAEQEELANRISGSAGAHGLVGGAYKVEKERTVLWTRSNSYTVRAVFEYYRDTEARLLLLRVEYMHAHPKLYSGHYIATQIEKVRQTLEAQTSLRKELPSPRIVADTRTQFDWYLPWLVMQFPRYGGARAAAEVGPGWLHPYAKEIEALVKGHEVGWAHWINRESGGGLTVPANFAGVWIVPPVPPSTSASWSNCFSPNGTIVAINPSNNPMCGHFLNRVRTTDYW
jgi:hypothetical protein